MTPTMETVVPPHIERVLSGLHKLDDPVAKDAAAIISAFVAAAAPDHVTVCLSTNTALRGGVTVQLSPNQAVVMSLLAKNYPSVAGVHDMNLALWGPRSGHSINTVRVMMTDLRKRLAPLKVAIQNQNGRGYRLELQPIIT